MKKQYKYTLLKQDGTVEDLGVGPKRSFKELYGVLNCSTIEIINHAYYEGRGYGRCTMLGDEEARFNSENHRNPHFNVLKGDPELGEELEWDVVGDIIKEEVFKGEL